MKTKDLSLCAIFVALIILGAMIKIPIPIVPFTLQILFTMLAGLLLGGKRGFLCVILYIIMGLLGFPVFVEGGGLAYVLKPTFGYILGFAVAAYVTGVIANKGNRPCMQRLLIANFIGLAIVYCIGMLYYYVISYVYAGVAMGLWTLFLYCFILAVPGDIVLCIVAAVIARRVIPIIRKKEM